MSETLASAVERFLVSRRALGRKYRSEESELRLLLRFAGERRAGRLDQLTPALLEEFQPPPRRRRLPAGLGGSPGAAGSLAASDAPAAGDIGAGAVPI
jgi:hypothetical protein